MKYEFLGSQAQHCPVLILATSPNSQDIQAEYITPFELNPDYFAIGHLYQDHTVSKTTHKTIKSYVTEEIIPLIKNIKSNYVVVTDSDYFKVMARLAKSEPYIGQIIYSEFIGANILYAPNYKQIYYNPEATRSKIAASMVALCNVITKKTNASTFEYKELFSDFQIQSHLNYLIMKNEPVAIYAETFGSKHPDSAVATVSISEANGSTVSFTVDFEVSGNIGYSKNIASRNVSRRNLLKNFFNSFNSTIYYHDITQQAYMLIYNLFINNILDQKGLLEGMSVMLKNFECTKIMAYVATNSCAGNNLDIISQSLGFEFAQDMSSNIANIHKKDLLLNNAKLSYNTFKIYEKYADLSIGSEPYETLLKPSVFEVIQMQLTGLPVDINRVSEVKAILLEDQSNAYNALTSFNLIKHYQSHLYDNKESLNLNSSFQIQDLLYSHMNLPIFSRTKKGNPSTDINSINFLIDYTDNKEIKQILRLILDYKSCSKILSDFIPSFEAASAAPDGWHYLFGKFHIGGAISGRLSSTDPNLQNIPANSKYAKLIKSCIKAPPGWIFIGIDFDSLEDKISAITTKDPNKIKVYTDGYDSHSFRAYTYYRHLMPKIQNIDVESINSIAQLYPDLRQDSKIPTFLLTYLGTYHGIVNQTRISEAEAKRIEAEYHELYKVSDKWVYDQLCLASQEGYVELAFGLKLKTPLLSQCVFSSGIISNDARSESRTAGNALGQCGCMLNSRAASEFMTKTRESEYKELIKPCAQIHDSQYFLVKDDVALILYSNEHLVQAIQWQNHPYVYSDQVKMSGQLCIYYPDWSKEIKIPNNINEEEIFTIIEKSS